MAVPGAGEDGDIRFDAVKNVFYAVVVVSEVVFLKDALPQGPVLSLTGEQIDPVAALVQSVDQSLRQPAGTN